MTTRRRDGGRDETPFGAWLRGRSDLDSVQHWLDVCDADFVFHRYKTHSGRAGTRRVKQVMMVEVKTHGRMPPRNQLETLWLWHQIAENRKQSGLIGLRGLPGEPSVNMWSWGVYVLQLATDCPSRGGATWHYFDDDGHLVEYVLDGEDELAAVLGFNRRPNEPWRQLDVRSHHATRTIVRKRTMPLGFVTDEVYRHSS